MVGYSAFIAVAIMFKAAAVIYPLPAAKTLAGAPMNNFILGFTAVAAKAAQTSKLKF